MSRVNLMRIPQMANNAAMQPMRQQELTQQQFNHRTPTKSKQEQLKEEEAQQRREKKEEVLKLSKLTKPQLRKYFQDQIDENEEDD